MIIAHQRARRQTDHMTQEPSLVLTLCIMIICDRCANSTEYVNHALYKFNLFQNCFADVMKTHDFTFGIQMVIWSIKIFICLFIRLDIINICDVGLNWFPRNIYLWKGEHHRNFYKGIIFRTIKNDKCDAIKLSTFLTYMLDHVFFKHKLFDIHTMKNMTSFTKL